MRDNQTKRTLAAGGVAVGTMVFEFNTTGIGRIIGATGADFVIFDMEHTGWSIETIRMLMATTRAADVVPMVRVPATQYHLLSRPLDVGAMGLMVPMVEDETQARLIVDSATYPPQGRRGCAFGVAHEGRPVDRGEDEVAPADLHVALGVAGVLGEGPRRRGAELPGEARTETAEVRERPRADGTIEDFIAGR